MSATDPKFQDYLEVEERRWRPQAAKKAGFEDKKIRNILKRASKQGTIKRSGRGINMAGKV